MHIQINQEEAKILRAAMNALSASARSDEPHYAHTEEFRALDKRINKFASLA